MNGMMFLRLNMTCYDEKWSLPEPADSLEADRGGALVTRW